MLLSKQGHLQLEEEGERGERVRLSKLYIGVIWLLIRQGVGTLKAGG